MRSLQLAALLAATMTMGTMAGVFFLYSHAIMPGLGRSDDRTFVGAFQQVDTAIETARFVPVVGGAIAFTALAAVLHLDEDWRRPLPWIVAALVLYLAAMAITGAVNVPSNHAIRREGDPDLIADLAKVRERFDEKRWVAWNLVRTVLTATAFGLLAWALVLSGRVEPA